MFCGKVKHCGKLIAWAEPKTKVICPHCGEIAVAGAVARVPNLGPELSKKQQKGRQIERWQNHESR